MNELRKPLMLIAGMLFMLIIVMAIAITNMNIIHKGTLNNKILLEQIEIILVNMQNK